MATVNLHELPEVFRPQDSGWASRAAARGEIRRLARGLYTRNLTEPAEQLIRRRWHEVAALYFPDAVIVDRSAVLAGPAEDGSLFLDVGSTPRDPRRVQLPGLTLRPRNGPGPLPGDARFAGLHISGQARTALENLRPSRARAGVARTLRARELEEWLDRLAQSRGEGALGELLDGAREIAPALDGARELAALERVIGTLRGSREGPLRSRAARARAARLPFDTARLSLFERLRAELAAQQAAIRPEPSDPQRMLAFFEAYFSNWIEGTVFELEEAHEIVFEGRIPAARPADAHDIQGTFEAVMEPSLRAVPPSSPEMLEGYLRRAHRLVMGGRPHVGPGEYKQTPNRAGATVFVAPELVAGTLREGFATMQTLPAGLPRAVFAMFLVSEVHPFADGNGRVARLLMNAQLSSVGQCRVVVPLCFRDEYLGALRALSRTGNARPIWRAIDRLQDWAAKMPWGERDRLARAMELTNALRTPEETSERNLHLSDPP